MSSKVKLSSSPIPYSFIPSESEQDNPNKLFLGGVSLETTEKQLEEFFSQFGKVKDVRIVTDRVTAACKGYGFVTFNDEENVEHLVERKTLRMNGIKLRIRKAIRRNASQFEHLTDSKKWVVMPSSAVNPQTPSSFLTPPNSPQNAGDLTLNGNEPLNKQGLYNRHVDMMMESVPVLITSNPRLRTNSSPPQPVYRQDTADSFSYLVANHTQPQTGPPPPATYHYRQRSNSDPITIQELLQFQEIHHFESITTQQHQPPVLIPNNHTPSKLFNSVKPMQFNQPGNQYFFPCYQIPENIMYCVQPPPPTTTILPPPAFHPITPPNIIY